jgi:hypothetical protein
VGGRGERGEAARVAQLLGRGEEAVDGRPREPATDADPLGARLDDLAQRQPRTGEHVDGLRDGSAHRTDLVAAKPGRVEHVGASAGVRLQTADRVLEVGVAADVVLGARRERERKAQAPRRLGSRDYPLDGVIAVVNLPVGVVVLDRAADRSGRGRPGDGQRRVLRPGAVAVLQVDRDRERGGLIEDADVGSDLVEVDAAVGAPERERETGARTRQRPEPERREHLRRAGVPRVGDDERLALVKRAEVRRLLLLSRSHEHGVSAFGGVGSAAERAVADPVARPRAETGGAVVGIGEPAAVERETAATDALGEPGLEALELGDALVDPRGPLAREARPVAAGRHPSFGQLGELPADLLE